MKKELPLVIEHARKPFDFGSVPGAPEYATVLARRLKLKEAAGAKGGGVGGGGSSLAAASASSSSSAAVPVAADDDGVADAAIRTSARVFDADKWENDPAEKAAQDLGVVGDTSQRHDEVFQLLTQCASAGRLVQPSSAFVERVFSHTKLIIEQIGISASALRLVVLVQPSSAFVERVFSQIKLIIEQIGVSGLE
eukprot:CAMPEP_0171992058 /NCGR_PEP_ID=MMETSP0993-20121228/277746_1 /TAXON_ID=483369 /ORGANISM="non described non described, Strain CCMP2098" /LENGTH=194 /DNA_ID=CAMNT_0012645101 /DNA_START=203 /DNA_END=787 /DNA_ORIENTATION=+